MNLILYIHSTALRPYAIHGTRIVREEDASNWDEWQIHGWTEDDPSHTKLIFKTRSKERATEVNNTLQSASIAFTNHVTLLIIDHHNSQTWNFQ